MNTQPKQTFKKNLALVFDEDFSTRSLKWNNWVDYLIIVMIVISTVAVFLGTFKLSSAWQKALNVVDWIVQIFFTIEVSLRIWSADEIDPKYKGFKGRIKYCLSFYGLIDFLSTYPMWIGMVFPMIPVKLLQLFRVLRVVRLFRVFRYMKAFRFLGEAVSSKKRELFVSLMFLVIVTIVLSFTLFLVEHNANPDMVGNGWRSIVWSFAKYIGDPGQIADEPLVTTGGKIISLIVGVMGIAIFAVPIGLLSSGFSEAIEKDRRSEELDELRERMGKAFRRSASLTLREYLNKQPDKGGEKLKVMNLVPQYVPVSKLQVRQGMDMKDITEVCRKFPEFSLKNLAQIHGEEEAINTVDRFVVEAIPINRNYGCCVDRGSKVTILSTSSWDEVGMGHFCYYLALLGGFNYIGKEIDAYPDEADSFYNYSKELLYNKKKREEYPAKEVDVHLVFDKKASFRSEFEEDLKICCKGEISWVVIITEHIKNSANSVDIHLAESLRDGSDPTVDDKDGYLRLCGLMDEAMKELNLTVQQSSQRYPLMKKNIGYHIRKKINSNANCFVLRPSSELINSAQELPMAYRLAMLLSEVLDGGHGITDDDEKDLKTVGFGYKEKNYAKAK